MNTMNRFEPGARSWKIIGLILLTLLFLKVQVQASTSIWAGLEEVNAVPGQNISYTEFGKTKVAEPNLWNCVSPYSIFHHGELYVGKTPDGSPRKVIDEGEFLDRRIPIGENFTSMYGKVKFCSWAGGEKVEGQFKIRQITNELGTTYKVIYLRGKTSSFIWWNNFDGSVYLPDAPDEVEVDFILTYLEVIELSHLSILGAENDPVEAEDSSNTIQLSACQGPYRISAIPEEASIFDFRGGLLEWEVNDQTVPADEEVTVNNVNVRRDYRDRLIVEPTPQAGEINIEATYNNIGTDVPTTTVNSGINFQNWQLTRPNEELSQSFLLATRPSSQTLVDTDGTDRLDICITECFEDTDPPEVTWTFSAPAQNANLQGSGDAYYDTMVALEADRQPNGRNQQPVEVEVTAEVNGEQQTATARQEKGSPHYNVIRQEYEDVGYIGIPAAQVPYADPNGEPRDTEFMPEPADFSTQPETIPHSADFPTSAYNGERFFHSDRYNWHIVQQNVINGLENAINDMTQQERNAVRGANEFYYIYSNYRTPVANKNADGVANSTHMEGRAVDLDTLDPINGIGVNRWDRFYRRQNLTNCRAFARFLRLEAGATDQNSSGSYETNCPAGQDNDTSDESKVHAAWP